MVTRLHAFEHFAWYPRSLWPFILYLRQASNRMTIDLGRSWSNDQESTSSFSPENVQNVTYRDANLFVRRKSSPLFLFNALDLVPSVVPDYLLVIEWRGLIAPLYGDKSKININQNIKRICFSVKLISDNDTVVFFDTQPTIKDKSRWHKLSGDTITSCMHGVQHAD